MIIYNLDIMKKFFEEVYPKLVDDEVLFISLSSRAKYLTKEQKDSGIRINRNEMFHRRFFSAPSSMELFHKVVEYLDRVRIEENLLTGGDILSDYTTPSGNPIPLNTVSVYVNINPSSMMKAAASLCSDIVMKLVEKDPSWFLSITSKLSTEVQKAKSRRVLVDVDFDVPSDEAVRWVTSQIEFKAKIKTHSGYHVLFNRESLKGSNLAGVLAEAEERFENNEILINKNAMIPLPGTYQGGKPVYFL